MTTRTTLVLRTLLWVHAAAAPSWAAEDTPQRAIALFEAGDFEASRARFEEILDAAPDAAEAHAYLGRIAMQQAELDVAIDHLREAVKRDETNSMYRTWLGRAYVAKLQTLSFFAKGTMAGRALEQLEKAVKLDPSNVEARVSLAGYYANAPSIGGGRKKRAWQQLDEIMLLDPSRGKPILATLLIKDEEFDQAIEVLQACILMKPQALEHRYRLGMLYQRVQRYQEAFTIFEEILTIDPEDRDALYQFGRTAVFSGTHLERAIQCMQAYLALPVPPGYPGHDAAHWRLGMLFEHQREDARARREYEAAVALVPDEGKYQEALKSLEGR